MARRREWIRIVIEEGLRLQVLEPDDLLRHATPSVLATDLPPRLVATLLQVGMTSGSFNADLLVESLGAGNIAEYVPLPVLWASIDEVAGRIIAEHPLTAGAVSAEHAGAFVDEALAHAVLPNDDGPDIEVLDD